MAAKDNLNNYQFRYLSDEALGERFHTVLAFVNHPEKNEINYGRLEWDASTGKILNVHVKPEYRRRGIATGMYNYAQGLDVIKPAHSSWRTDAGDAWAKSVGGEIPPRDPLSPQ